MFTPYWVEEEGAITRLLLVLEDTEGSRDQLNLEILTAVKMRIRDRLRARGEQGEKGNHDGGAQGLFFFLEKVNNVIVDLISRF